MAFTNFASKEINCKVVYFGPKGAGKTENLRAVLRATDRDLQGGGFHLDGPPEPTEFFDFVPVSLGYVQDFHIKLHLYSLPLHGLYDSVTSVVLKGIDGWIFVADSRLERLVQNREALHETQRLIQDQGYHLVDLPRVIQYNKRDLDGVVPLNLLSSELNSGDAPEQEAVALNAQGTRETLEKMAKQVLRRLAPN